MGYPSGIRANRGTRDTPKPAATRAAPVSHSTASWATVGVNPASAQEVKTNWLSRRTAGILGKSLRSNGS